MTGPDPASTPTGRTSGGTPGGTPGGTDGARAVPAPFELPPYPYDRLVGVRDRAVERFGSGPGDHGTTGSGGVVDCSIGTPWDPPDKEIVAALASSGTERGYPASIGSPAYRTAAAGWLQRRFGVTVDPRTELAACVGTKEFVASTAQYLRLRRPDRDTVLYPAVSYPTYAMGATLAGCRAVPVAELPGGGPDLASVSDDDVGRALLAWVNSPANPSGLLTDLDGAARWGRARGVPVFSDECYAEFTWDGPPATVLATGTEGVVAVHSLSKRSNLAGVRAGFYAGDPELVGFLSEIRKHAGLMVPGPVQAAGAVAFGDDRLVDEQRHRYRYRLELLAGILASAGLPVALPPGGFYLWVPCRGAGDAWELTDALAVAGGLLVSPGDLYGEAGAGHLRVAVVQPSDRLRLVGERLAGTVLGA